MAKIEIMNLKQSLNKKLLKALETESNEIVITRKEAAYVMVLLCEPGFWIKIKAFFKAIMLKFS